MLSRLARHMRRNTVAWLALFVALGGTAYAANTVRSSDIVDGEVKSIDVGQNEIGSADVKDNSINTFDVHSFLGADVVDRSLTAADIDFESITGNEIADGSLKLGDIAAGGVLNRDITVGNVAATTCASFNVNVAGITPNDVVILTPQTNANPALMYDARMGGANTVTIYVCNFANATINDGTTTFNVALVKGPSSSPS
jgi:hypothetical protein